MSDETTPEVSAEKLVEFSRNFGQNIDEYKDLEAKPWETGDEGYDCE